GRWPGMLLCGNEARAADLVAAAGSAAGYFVVESQTPAQAAAVGRRLAGPLRMPDFPEWIDTGD
ncbi:MAG: hypothetical protein ACREOM_05560, partial [Candidatus Dormibacteraceae bacterium]